MEMQGAVSRVEVAPSQTRCRFLAIFSEVRELYQTEFAHPLYPPGVRRAVRGKDEGPSEDHGTFQWSAVVKVLAVYLLRCAAWGRGNRLTSIPSLEGMRSSPAASLNDALSKGTCWIHDMFGTDREGRPRL